MLRFKKERINLVNNSILNCLKHQMITTSPEDFWQRKNRTYYYTFPQELIQTSLPMACTGKCLPGKLSVAESRKKDIKSALMEQHNGLSGFTLSLPLCGVLSSAMASLVIAHFHLYEYPTHHSERNSDTLFYISFGEHTGQLTGGQSKILAFNYLITQFLGLV